MKIGGHAHRSITRAHIVSASDLYPIYLFMFFERYFEDGLYIAGFTLVSTSFSDYFWLTWVLVRAVVGFFI